MDILPCPFCGEQPVLQHREMWHEEGHGATKRVWTEPVTYAVCCGAMLHIDAWQKMWCVTEGKR